MPVKKSARSRAKPLARTRTHPVRVPPESAPAGFAGLLGDWYWEQDAQFRFTHVESRAGADVEGARREDIIGKCRWEIGLDIESPGGWPAHRALLESRQSFRNVVLRRLADGTARYFSVTGAPVYDTAGRFAGYRGIGNEITEQQRRDEDLQRFRAVVDASPDMIFLTDPDTLRFLYVNNTACRLAGYSREEYMKLGPEDVLMTTADELRRLYSEAIAAGEAGTISVFPAHTKDGTRTVVEVRRRAFRLRDKLTVVSISRDISQHIRSEKAIRRLTRMFAALSNTNEAIMRVKSPQELYQAVCDAAVNGGQFLTAAVLLPRADIDFFNIAAAAGALGQQLQDVRMSTDAARPEGRGLAGTAFRESTPCVTNDFAKDDRTRLWHKAAAAAGIKAAAAVPLVRADRAVGVLLLYSGEKRTFDDEVVKLLNRMAANIVFALERFELEAERRRAEERAQYLATHDGLTGLPNRVMFSQLLNLALESARRYERHFAVLFIDLDRFKVINDTLGHAAGDSLLKEMSTRLKGCLRASDVFARLGGDEFVALIQEVADTTQVATVARKILSTAIRPVSVFGQECRVTASVGISMFPGDAQDENSLMKNADMAMYLAKEEGKNNFQFYSKDIKARSLEHMAIETALRRAQELNQLSLHYQAKVDLKTRRITGVEALLRWQHPELGSVSPMQFIPIAEETGLIVPIGRWVLQTACAQNTAWQRQGLPPLCMAVNLSPRQFTDPDLLRDIAAALAESGLAPQLLEIEITEGMVMHHTERSIKIMRAIKEMGVRLAIDDFGTGYSSLAQLKRFPIDTLKVDRSFIRELPRDAEDRAITEAIIAMGKSLSLTIVAEGVETSEQQLFLHERACDEMQGYYFSKPIAPEQFAELVRTHRPAEPATDPD